MIKNTSGLQLFMSNGSTTPATITATAITNAKPAVVTVADSTGMKDGQLVTISGSGMPSLDGKTFIVAALSSTSFALTGSDATADTAGTAGTATYYDDATDMELLCLSSIGINTETSSPVSVATFCDPSGSVPGPEPQAPTMDLGFYLDKDSKGYCALLAAEADGKLRMFKIVFPDNGDLVMEGVVSSVNFTEMPLEGAVALTAQVTLSTKPIHRFDCV